MSDYEKKMEILEALAWDTVARATDEDCITPEETEAAFDTALDAMAFVKALNEMFRDNGADVPAHPDVGTLESLVDGIHGELAAACILLSERSFARVPDMLRACAAQLEKSQEVPTVVKKGYSRLADRLDNTRKTMQNIMSEQKKPTDP